MNGFQVPEKLKLKLPFVIFVKRTRSMRIDVRMNHINTLIRIENDQEDDFSPDEDSEVEPLPEGAKCTT